jgi:hypothetical protein
LPRRVDLSGFAITLKKTIEAFRGNSLNTDENVFPLLLPVKHFCWKLLLFSQKKLFFHSQNPFQLFTIIKPLHVWFLETANFRF